MNLGADSLALVELGFQISETFQVPMLDTSGNKLIFKNLVEYIVDNLPEQTGQESVGWINALYINLPSIPLH